jgi:hypothetical protein
VDRRRLRAFSHGPARHHTGRALSPAFDLAQARADWRAACAKYGAAEKHYLEMCLNPPEPMLERDAVRSKRLEEIYEHEDKLGELTDRQCNVATRIVAAPASIETLSLKLEIFRYWWDKERNSDEPATVDPPLNGGDAMDVAAGIVLDILTMIRRGDGGVAEIGNAA